MSLTDLLIELAEKNIYLWVNGNKLKILFPRGVMTPQIRAEIAKYKTEILKLSPLFICPDPDLLPLYLTGQLEESELEKIEF